MVNPSFILKAIPLAGMAAAIYVPQENDPAFVNAPSTADAKEVAERAQAHAAKLLHDGAGDHAKNGVGCHKGKKYAKKQYKKLDKKLKKHGMNPPPAAAIANPDAIQNDRVSTQVVESSPLIELNGIISHVDPDMVIPDKYIVVLKDGADVKKSLSFLAESSQLEVENLVQAGEAHPLTEETAAGFDISHIYDSLSVKGYAGRFLPKVAELIAAQPEVAFVERDSKVFAMKSKEEEKAPWGLARVSHREHLGFATYDKYLYDSDAGEGVTSYIVDTGIYIDHEDFEGRAVWGKTMPDGDTDTDAHGHGSHCAGTIGGKTYGVAKKAKLVAVKVLGSDGSGSMSDVIGGVEYVVEAHRKEKKEKGGKLKGSTANMSLGGGKSPALDLAVNAATEAGVHFAVAAGNENQDACNTSPAAADGPVTVGASTVNDDRAYFSNYGKCVDIFAPGVNVLSVGTYSPTSTALMSGTSMASPHIAGLLTYFVSLQPSSDSLYSTRGAISTKELKKYLINFGTTGALTDLDSESPNVLAYNGGGEDLSSFWSGSAAENDSDDEDDDEDKSFLGRVGEYFEDVVEEIEDSLHELF